MRDSHARLSRGGCWLCDLAPFSYPLTADRRLWFFCNHFLIKCKPGYILRGLSCDSFSTPVRLLVTQYHADRGLPAFPTMLIGLRLAFRLRKRRVAASSEFIEAFYGAVWARKQQPNRTFKEEKP